MSFSTDSVAIPYTEPGHWKLPPLILHPFSGDKHGDELMAGANASLMLHGLMPPTQDKADLNILVMRGRLQEIRMLYYLGRDVQRWLEQCVDFAHRDELLAKCKIPPQGFANMLVERTPPSVARKLTLWGVADYRSVFSRAIGLTNMLGDAPGFGTFAFEFLENYHRYSDYLYLCYLNLVRYPELAERQFQMEIYASAEYSDMLAAQWSAE